MITEDQRAIVAARWAVDPPEPTEPEVARLAALLTSWRLRIARDRARTSTSAPPLSRPTRGRHRVTAEEPPGDQGRNHHGARGLRAPRPASGAGDRV